MFATGWQEGYHTMDVLGAFFFTFAGGSTARPPELGGASAMDGGERGRREGRGRVWGKWRQMGVGGFGFSHRQAGQGRTSARVPPVRALSVSPQTERKFGPGMG